MTEMMTEATLAKLYRDACQGNDRLPADFDIADLIDLAQGRLAGERRARLVDAIAASPALASVYRLAKAGGAWSHALAADLAQEATSRGATVHRLPKRHVRPAVAARRYPLAMAAAVGAMAVGALFVAQQLQAPAEDVVGDDFTSAPAHGTSDAIASHSFDPSGRSPSNADVIFTTRDVANSDRIFSFGTES